MFFFVISFVTDLTIFINIIYNMAAMLKLSAVVEVHVHTTVVAFDITAIEGISADLLCATSRPPCISVRHDSSLTNQGSQSQSSSSLSENHKTATTASLATNLVSTTILQDVSTFNVTTAAQPALE